MAGTVRSLASILRVSCRRMIVQPVDGEFSELTGKMVPGFLVSASTQKLMIIAHFPSCREQQTRLALL